jgi:hypothetical protein
LTDKILEELGDDYKELVRVVQAREKAISFDELHEKLLMYEASLQTTTKAVNFPPTAHLSNRTSGRYPFTNAGRPHPTPWVEIGAPLLTNNTATQDRLWPLITQPPTTDFNQGHIWGIVKYVAFKVTQ